MPLRRRRGELPKPGDPRRTDFLDSVGPLLSSFRNERPGWGCLERAGASAGSKGRLVACSRAGRRPLRSPGARSPSPIATTWETPERDPGRRRSGVDARNEHRPQTAGRSRRSRHRGHSEMSSLDRASRSRRAGCVTRPPRPGPDRVRPLARGRPRRRDLPERHDRDVDVLARRQRGRAARAGHAPRDRAGSRMSKGTAYTPLGESLQGGGRTIFGASFFGAAPPQGTSALQIECEVTGALGGGIALPGSATFPLSSCRPRRRPWPSEARGRA